MHATLVALTALAVSTILYGCASSSTTPLSQNTVLVSASAAPACGRQGAQRVALNQAAAETLRRGYERFVIVGSQSASNVGVVGYTPMYGTTTMSGTSYGSTYYGSATTNVYGGQPIIGGSHEQDFAVRMFRPGDPGYENALDAKSTLGPEWQTEMNKKAVSCF